MTERIAIKTTFLGIPLRKEVIITRRVVKTDERELLGSKGAVDQFKTVVLGQSGTVFVEHHSELSFAQSGLCHRSEVSPESVKLKSRIPLVKRRLVKSK